MFWLPLLAFATVATIVAGGKRARVGAKTAATYPLEDSEETRQILEIRANAIAHGNAVWFASHPDAPCCSECAELRYVDPPICGSDDSCQLTLDAPALLLAGRGTCIDIASYDCGHALSEGKDCRVVLAPMKDDSGVSIPFAYHAMLWTNGEWSDPTEAVIRATVGGCGCGGRDENDED